MVSHQPPHVCCAHPNVSGHTPSYSPFYTHTYTHAHTHNTHTHTHTHIHTTHNTHAHTHTTHIHAYIHNLAAPSPTSSTGATAVSGLTRPTGWQKNWGHWLMTPGTHWSVVHMHRVGQNHIYTVCIRYFWQGNHWIYGHMRCIFTVLANPTLDMHNEWRNVVACCVQWCSVRLERALFGQMVVSGCKCCNESRMDDETPSCRETSRGRRSEERERISFTYFCAFSLFHIVKNYTLQCQSGSHS